MNELFKIGQKICVRWPSKRWSEYPTWHSTLEEKYGGSNISIIREINEERDMYAISRVEEEDPLCMVFIQIRAAVAVGTQLTLFEME